MTDDATTPFQWEDPPKRARSERGRRPNTYWTSVADALREQSGAWARVAVCDTGPKAASLTARIRKGHSRAFAPPQHFDATHRLLEDGTHGVWVRHIGQPDADGAEPSDPEPTDSAVVSAEEFA